MALAPHLDGNLNSVQLKLELEARGSLAGLSFGGRRRAGGVASGTQAEPERHGVAQPGAPDPGAAGSGPDRDPSLGPPARPLLPLPGSRSRTFKLVLNHIGTLWPGTVARRGTTWILGTLGYRMSTYDIVG